MLERIKRTIDRVQTQRIFEEPWEYDYKKLGRELVQLKSAVSPTIYWGRVLEVMKLNLQVRREERTILLRQEINSILNDRKSKGLDIPQTDTVFSHSSEE